MPGTLIPITVLACITVPHMIDGVMCGSSGGPPVTPFLWGGPPTTTTHILHYHMSTVMQASTVLGISVP